MLKITAEMKTPPVIPPGRWPLPLDSMIAWAYSLDLPERGVAADPAETDLFGLPFEKYGGGDDWYWAASRILTSNPEDLEEVQWLHAANSELDYLTVTDVPENIVESNKKWKPSRKPQVTTIDNIFFWYCEPTDVKKLETLLDRIENIGRNWSRGYGQISQWRIDETDTHWQDWWRPIPDLNGTVEETIRPPYWHPTQRRKVRTYDLD